eukprot:1172709-Prorocentrum_minimum.AAC.1
MQFCHPNGGAPTTVASTTYPTTSPTKSSPTGGCIRVMCACYSEYKRGTMKEDIVKDLRLKDP